MAKAKPFKIPKSLAACADLLYSTRQARLDMQKQVDALKEQENALRDYVIENLPKSNATGVAGKLARIQVVTAIEPVVEDWDALYKTIKRTGHFDLLNRALNRSAVRERWNAGKTVPGVGEFTAVKVSINKL